MKIYNGDNIRASIPGNYATFDNGDYILIWPAPATYLKPYRPAYGYVCKQLLTAAPHKYPGGAYSIKKYIVAYEKTTYPAKYRAMITTEEIA